jgi:pimeloyl-ACP methyl ester carboxylesterase
MRARARLADVDPPQETGTTGGLAWSLFLPPGTPAGGVVVLHGAGSCKESHFDFARACRTAGLAALAFDARGHGASGGALDGGAIDDVVAMADLLRERAGRVALRGSSMGGYFALVAAARAGAAAVLAICPASGAMLARGLRERRFEFAADAPALERLLEDADERDAAARLEVPLLLMHAEGDESVPIAHSRELHALAPHSKLVAMPGGHHRSIQHDPELQGMSVRWLTRALTPPGPSRG